MLSLIKQARPSTDRIRKTALQHSKGGASVYILSIFIMFFILIIFKGYFDRERLYVTYDSVDDAIVASLVSSCVYNQTEYGISGQTVIFRQLTPVKPPDVEIPGWGELLPGSGDPEEPYQALEDPEIYIAAGDAYLENCYQSFVKNLKRNLKLDEEMNSTMSGIEGPVEIEKFTVYNVFRNYDEDGNETSYRVVAYTRTGETWSVYPYSDNTPANVYSTFDHCDIPIQETSVAAQLTFMLRVSDYEVNQGDVYTGGGITEKVSYQRVVDILKN